MTTTTDQLRHDIKDSLSRLRTLRDEARVKIHLASMDARDSWARLEPKLEEAERAAEHASKATLDAIDGAVKKVSDFIGSL